MPQLFTTEDGSSVVTAVWNVTTTDEGHTTVGIVLDTVHDTLTVVENEEQQLGLYQKYCVCGIATTNGLAFDVVVSDECVTCAVGEDVSNRVATEADNQTDSNKPVLH
ncbi:hypothetical protein [Polynucleobacter sp. JS-JIR-5-A7]|uniref:hypothetical protein n=1 Tax=Polynucleobacter sp. JS-JIR-5-A7 TaxID=1758395 RepID=UPI001BFEAD86|nr:hypothetical protein [Polynucleobacter sp. JS-JIR-5-A7]QWE06055.1 hypothetical protein AOC29_08010 [Polynucleobacter sp. JS-JIR-5-A7]